ncbi:Hypothetical protein PBC10988_36580 [Planctomycetales bacterium 10988]|nr:Hypothetical protein PBC10988_36580 [Planctomycetales bacterium 10988]
MAGSGTIDAFMQILDPVVEGETIDKEFKEKKAIEILSFEFGDQGNLAEAAYEDADKERSSNKKSFDNVMDELKFFSEKNKGGSSGLLSKLRTAKHGSLRDQEQMVRDELGKDARYKDIAGRLREQRKVQRRNHAKKPPEERKKSYIFRIDKKLDLSSPPLFHAYCSTSMQEQNKVETFGEVKLFFRELGGIGIFLQYDFKECKIRGYELHTEADSILPSETITFSFLSCTMTYWPQTERGVADPLISRGWDFQTNEPLGG